MEHLHPKPTPRPTNHQLIPITPLTLNKPRNISNSQALYRWQIDDLEGIVDTTVRAPLWREGSHSIVRFCPGHIQAHWSVIVGKEVDRWMASAVCVRFVACFGDFDYNSNVIDGEGVVCFCERCTHFGWGIWDWKRGYITFNVVMLWGCCTVEFIERGIDNLRWARRSKNCGESGLNSHESHICSEGSELLMSILQVHTLQDGFSTSYMNQKKAQPRRLISAISRYSPFSYCQWAYGRALTGHGVSDSFSDMFKRVTAVHWCMAWGY